MRPESKNDLYACLDSIASYLAKDPSDLSPRALWQACQDGGAGESWDRVLRGASPESVEEVKLHARASQLFAMLVAGFHKMGGVEPPKGKP